MKSCKNCGAELNDKAIICPECGEAQTSVKDQSSDDGFFSMPYLSAELKTSMTNNKKQKSTKVNDSDADTEINNENENNISDQINDKITDPLERAFAKRDKRNKLIRIIALVLACVLIISTGAYFLFRSKGYNRTLDKYIDGRTSSGGSKYLSIVPEIYLINAESLYKMSRPEIKSTTNNYLKYVENQYTTDFGSGLTFTYKIISERTVDDSGSISTIEDNILSTYKTEIDISEAAYVTIRLTTKGSVTQSNENMTLTFYKYDGNWYSMEAMEIVQFACENVGYNLW